MIRINIIFLNLNIISYFFIRKYKQTNPKFYKQKMICEKIINVNSKSFELFEESEQIDEEEKEILMKFCEKIESQNIMNKKNSLSLEKKLCNIILSGQKCILFIVI